MTASLDDLIAQARLVAAQPSGPRRDALWIRQANMAAPIVDERNELLRLLNAGYDRLNETAPADDPKYDAKEERWFAWLHRYEAIVDALAEATTLITASPPTPNVSTPSFFPSTSRTP